MDMKTYGEFHKYLQDSYFLGGAHSLLGWDQQVNMPPGGAESRAKQIEIIDLILHRRITDPSFTRLVSELSQNDSALNEDQKVNLRETRRSLERQNKLNEAFVSERSLATARAFSVWTKARPANDFKMVEPYLEKIVELCRKECDLVGYEENPYDALLDVYEPYAKLSVVKPTLLSLADSLKELIPKIIKKHSFPAASQATFEEDKQLKLCKEVCADLGFDFSKGRLDKSAHPFQSTIGHGDVRMTLRFHEDSIFPALYGAMHETGHALYEMGLLEENIGTPMGAPISLGIHESQSRFWENFLGRSQTYIEYLHKKIKNYFPDFASKASPTALWNEANRVEPSLIRVEADEVTYSIHIVIRMILEEALLKNELQVKDLPSAWDDLYEKYLGIRSPNLKDGVLQDVHWYGGSIGYFPTYALGNIFAAMMLEKMEKDIGPIKQHISEGDFSKILGWLRRNIHQHGMKYKSEELVTRVTGQEISSLPFINYLKEKFEI